MFYVSPASAALQRHLTQSANWQDIICLRKTREMLPTHQEPALYRWVPVSRIKHRPVNYQPANDKTGWMSQRRGWVSEWVSGRIRGIGGPLVVWRRVHKQGVFTMQMQWRKTLSYLGGLIGSNPQILLRLVEGRQMQKRHGMRVILLERLILLLWTWLILSYQVIYSFIQLPTNISPHVYPSKEIDNIV